MNHFLTLSFHQKNWQEFIEFIKNPIPYYVRNTSTKKAINQTISIIGITLFLSYTLQGIFYSFLYLMNLPLPDNQIFEKLPNYNFLSIFLFICVVIPILEELLFRLPLRYKPEYFFSSILLSYFFIPSSQSTIGHPYSIQLFLIIAVFAIAIFFISYLKQKNSHKIWEKYFKKIIYIAALLFAIPHVFNYDTSLNFIWFYAPILIAPLFLISLALSMIRLKYGLLYSIFGHFIINVIALIFYYIFILIN